VRRPNQLSIISQISMEHTMLFNIHSQLD